ncbi:MAG: universal stress protein [Candidatus Dormibacteria bacterium]
MTDSPHQDASVAVGDAAAPAPGAVTGPPPPARGRLKAYLGAMPGSGKTFAMLREGRDRRDAGEDVVIGFIETHGRARTAEAIGTLEVLPRISVDYRGTKLSEMDVDAVLARHPQVALIDELAHTNAPGVRHHKRWEDIEDIRDAGIDVITTMNIQHLESMKDVVERITGITVHETVPDAVLDRADDVQFIDITPEALRKRMRHGNVYPLERVDMALRNFFRPGNLGALRELGLRLVAERVEEDRGGVQTPPEDVLAAVGGGPAAEALIRRGVRQARRRRGFCTVVHVRTLDDPPIEPGADEAGWHRLAAELQTTVVEPESHDVAATLIGIARDRGCRHVVMGEPQPRRLFGRMRKSVVDRVIEGLPDADVHVIARYAAVPYAPQDRPDPDSLLRDLNPGRPHGGLRLYIGYARGAGATTRMLDEARRRAARGTDVVVGAVSGGGAARLGSLPLLGGPASPAARGVLDVEALLTRNPDVVAIDDLAGLTTTGRLVGHVLPRIRAAGINVIGTVHLTDLRSTVSLMGRLLYRPKDRPVLDDSAVDAADEVELVDVPPVELEERLRQGEIMVPGEALQALQSEFRPEVLTTLRELALRRVAEHCDRRLVAYMSTARIQEPWEARPRVLVLVPPRPGQEAVIRRAAAHAVRRDDALTAVSVRRKPRSDEEKRLLGGYATLTHQLAGDFVTIDGRDVATTVAEYARGHRITEILVMRSTRNSSSRTLRSLIRLVANVDVHVVAAGD